MSEALLSAVDAFLSTTGMAESSFGRGAVNDWSFIRGLRAGRRVWPETEAKVRAFMAARLEQNTSAPQHGGNASPVKAAIGGRESPASEGAAPSGGGGARDSREPAPADRWAGRVVQCAVCERRLTGTTVRACQAPDCPQSEREAA
jgi:hypothetical protein